MGLLLGNTLTVNQQSVETTIDDWASTITSSSSTVTSTTQAFDGVNSIRATYNGTVNNAMASITSTGSNPPVVASKGYSFYYWVYSPRAVNFACLVEWYTSGDVYISDIGQSGITAVPVNTWTKVSLPGLTSAATAAKARVYLMCQTGLTTGDLVYFDQVYLGIPAAMKTVMVPDGAMAAMTRAHNW